jgi:hypothetical protein
MLLRTTTGASQCSRVRGVRRWWCRGGVVGGNTAKWVVLSEKTSTLAPVGMTIGASAGNGRPATKSAHAENKENHE